MKNLKMYVACVLGCWGAGCSSDPSTSPDAGAGADLVSHDQRSAQTPDKGPASDKGPAADLDEHAPDLRREPRPDVYLGDISCVPRTCATESVECGEIADGCGGTVPCGGCVAGVSACVAGKCRALDCGDEPKNVCGACQELKMGLGESCGCQGMVTVCNSVQELECDDGTLRFAAPKKLADTDDAKDEWTELKGAIHGMPDTLVFDSDEYAVWVDDTFWGVMSPELELDYDFSKGGQLCIGYHEDTQVLGDTGNFMRCTGGGQSDTKLGACCLQVPAGKGTFAMSAAINFGVPDALDGDGTFTISVSGTRDATTPVVCELYTLRYRF